MARPLTRRPGTGAAALPQWIRPQLTQLVDAAPDGAAWRHEIKFDGYRMHARLDRGAVKLLTRRRAVRLLALPAMAVRGSHQVAVKRTPPHRRCRAALSFRSVLGLVVEHVIGPRLIADHV